MAVNHSLCDRVTEEPHAIAHLYRSLCAFITPPRYRGFVSLALSLSVPQMLTDLNMGSKKAHRRDSMQAMLKGTLPSRPAHLAL
jgi:hypothetical protein